MPGGSPAQTQEAEPKAPWSIGLAYGQFDTDLGFTSDAGDFDASLFQRMLVMQLRRVLGDGWSIGATAGLILDGDVSVGGRRGRFGLGFALAVDVEKTWVYETSDLPFVTTSLKLAVSHAVSRMDTGEAAGFTGVDFRLAATVGKTLFGWFTPYLSARLFGGPILWTYDGAAAVGSDKYHAQIAIGASVDPDGALKFFVDWSPLLERSVWFGLSGSF